MTAVIALLETASYRAEDSASSVIARIARVAAQSVSAEQVAFLRREPGGALHPQSGSREPALPIEQATANLEWRIGDRLLGVIVAYGHLTNDALSILEVAGLAAALAVERIEVHEKLNAMTHRLDEANAVRRQLLGNIAAGGDEARRRFASRLHDESLQLLTAVELQLERARSLTTRAEVASSLEDARTTAAQLEESLRELLFQVRPPAIQLSLGLADAVRDRLEVMRSRSGVESDLRVNAAGPIGKEAERVMTQVVLEALGNVERHAHATRVNVACSQLDGGLHCVVTDDGVGFVLSERTSVPGHLGLLEMKERAQMAGGWCRISSDPGAGTVVEAWIPEAI